MAIANTAHGGTATNTTTSATSLAITVTAVAGEFIFVTISTLAANATTAVADNIGNKYYILNDQIGASGRISCWFCPKSSGTVATVTATHAASAASGSVSTYTGVLGVGHCQKTTNAANNNTITMSPVIGAGNVMLAGMGDAVGTQTWTAVTGTLRNNIAGGGASTPGATNIDSLVSGGSTLAASLSSSVSGEAIAIELLSAALPLAMDLNLENSIPSMRTMGTVGMLQYMQETEQFDWSLVLQPAGGLHLMGFRGYWSLKAGMGSEFESWGFKTPPPSVTSSFEDEQYFMQRTIVPEIEREQEDFGIVLGGASGTNLMGFRGNTAYPSSMVELDLFGFQTAVVQAISAFDDVDQAIEQELGFMSDETEKDNWGWLPPMVQVSLDDSHPEYRFNKFDAPSELEAITEDFIAEMVSIDELYTGQVCMSSIYQDDDVFGFNTPVVTVKQAFDDDQLIPGLRGALQWTDDDITQSEFFATDRVPEDYEQFLITGPLSLYWTDDDASQSTFFAKEQYADMDEQFIPAYMTRYQEDDVFGFNVPEVLGELLLEEEIQQPNNPYPLWQQVEDEQFGQNAPFLTATSEVWELAQWPNLPYPVTHQVELDQIGQNAPFLTSQPFDDTDQIGQTYWVRDVDDNWGFNTPEIEGELLLQEEVQRANPPFPLWQQVEDEQFGQNAPFITAVSFDDSPDQTASIAKTYDDFEQFGFDNPFAIYQEDTGATQSTYNLVDDVFGFDLPFIPQEDGDVTQKTITVQEDEGFGFQTTTVTMALDGEVNPSQQGSYYFSAEDLEKYNWGWLPPVTKVAEDDAPYDSRVQLQSYFVPAIEDEQFSWGFDKYYALGSEDVEQQLPQQSFWFHWQGTDEDKTDSTFFAREQYGEGLEIQIPQISFYFTELETEQFDWGFNTPVVIRTAFDEEQFSSTGKSIYAEDEIFGQQVQFIALDQDEVPVIIKQRLLHEEDFGQQVQFYADTVDAFQVLSLQLVDQVEEVNTGRPFVDADSSEVLATRIIAVEDEPFGFRQAVITAYDQDELIPAQRSQFQDDDPFGFQQQFVMALDDSQEHFPATQRLYAEEDIWGYSIGFSTESDSEATPVNIPGYSLDEFISGLEILGFIEGVFEVPNDRVNIQDEDRQVSITSVQSFSFGDEVEHVPNPPYPITYQPELDQIGQNPPFITSQPFAWEEDGVPPNQPWARLDVTDYNDFIKNIISELMKIREVNIKKVLAIMTIAAVRDMVLAEIANRKQFAVTLAQNAAALIISEVQNVPLLSVQLVTTFR